MTSRGELVTAAFEQREAIVRGTSSLAGVTGAVPRFHVDGEAESSGEGMARPRRRGGEASGSRVGAERGGGREVGDGHTSNCDARKPTATPVDSVLAMAPGPPVGQGGGEDLHGEGSGRRGRAWNCQRCGGDGGRAGEIVGEVGIVPPRDWRAEPSGRRRRADGRTKESVMRTIESVKDGEKKKSLLIEIEKRSRVEKEKNEIHFGRV